MELEEWGEQIKGRWCLDPEERPPTFDSTKANFDELEKDIKIINGRLDDQKKYFGDRLTALEDEMVTNSSVARTMDADIGKRLNALKAKVDAPESFVCGICANHPCGHEADYGCFKPKSPDAPEARVDAPREPLVYCRECDHKVWCPGVDRVEGCDSGKKQPPDTCGNCSRPARFDDNKHQVVCGYRKGKYENRWSCDTACPHYDRRA